MVEVVIDILIGDTTVQNLVGRNEVGDTYKIYPVITPQKEVHPYVTVRQTGKLEQAKNCGFAGSFAVFSYHKNYDQVKAIDLAIVAALKAAPATDLFAYAILTGTNDDFVTQANGDGLYSRISTFDCSYDESAT